MENLASLLYRQCVKNIVESWHISILRLSNLRILQVEQFIQMPWEKIVTNGNKSAVPLGAAAGFYRKHTGFVSSTLSMRLYRREAHVSPTCITCREKKTSYARSMRKGDSSVPFSSLHKIQKFVFHMLRVNRLFSTLSAEAWRRPVLFYWVLYYIFMRLFQFPCHRSSSITLIAVCSMNQYSAPCLRWVSERCNYCCQGSLTGVWFIIFYPEKILSYFETNYSSFIPVWLYSVGLPGL